jgi:hypothetical protein
VKTAMAPQMWEIRAENEARRKVQDVSAQLEAANVEMRAFRSEHMVLLGTTMCYRCSDITGREGLDRKWHELVLKRDKILQQWNTALEEFAAVQSHTTIGGAHAA